MITRILIGAASIAALSGCAANGDLTGVQNSPYTVPVNIGDGPPSDLRYPGRGPYAYDGDGNRVRLSRRERRQFRERFRNVQAQIEQNERVAEFNAQNAGPPEPVPSAPPVASEAGSQGSTGTSPREPSRGGGSLPR